MTFFFFFKQKTAYEMRISDWSSDVCSSDLVVGPAVADDLGMQDEAVALVAGDEVELDGAAPAADHRVVEAVRGGQDMALADQEARAVAAAAGLDAADGAPGVLHGVHPHPPLRRRDLQRRGAGGTGQPRARKSGGAGKR